MTKQRMDISDLALKLLSRGKDGLFYMPSMAVDFLSETLRTYFGTAELHDAVIGLARVALMMKQRYNSPMAMRQLLDVADLAIEPLRALERASGRRVAEVQRRFARAGGGQGVPCKAPALGESPPEGTVAVTSLVYPRRFR